MLRFGDADKTRFADLASYGDRVFGFGEGMARALMIVVVLGALDLQVPLRLSVPDKPLFLNIWFEETKGPDCYD